MPVVDSAIYLDGRREASPGSLEETFRALRTTGSARNRFAWIGLYRPEQDEITALADEFELHPLAVEDAIIAHQRPKLEHYGETLFVVLRPARYLDASEEIDIGELHAFVGPDFVITIRHAEEPDLAPVRGRLEQERELLRHGPSAVLYALLDRVVDDYLPVARGLHDDIEEIEAEVFGGEPAVSRRIYQLSREVVEFQRAVRPLPDMLTALRAGSAPYRVADEELRHNLRDVQDHADHVTERIEGYRQLLTNILTVNSSLVAQRQNNETTRLTETSITQNEQVKRISSWAAILFTPTLIGSVYGMNFTHMPELNWPLGYPMALGLMLMSAIVLYITFKRRDWL